MICLKRKKIEHDRLGSCIGNVNGFLDLKSFKCVVIFLKLLTQYFFLNDKNIRYLNIFNKSTDLLIEEFILKHLRLLPETRNLKS